MSTINLYKFYTDGRARFNLSNERYCQAMINHLAEVRPHLSNRIRGTDKDPFYCTSTKDPIWIRFVEFIEAHWFD